MDRSLLEQTEKETPMYVHPRDYFRPDNQEPTYEGLRDLAQAGFNTEDIVNYVCLETGIPVYDLSQVHPTQDVVDFLQLCSEHHPIGRVDPLPWIPLTMMGPIPVVGHFHPYTRDFFGLYRDLVFTVIITPDQYIQAAQVLAERLPAEFMQRTNGASALSGHGATTHDGLVEWLRTSRWCPKRYLQHASSEALLKENPQDHWLIDMLLQGRKVLPYHAVSLTERTLAALPQAMMEKYQMVCYHRMGDVYYITSSNPNLTRTRLTGELNARIGAKTGGKLDVVCSMAHPSFIEGAIRYLMTGGRGGKDTVVEVVGNSTAAQVTDTFKIDYDPAFARPLEEGMEPLEVLRWVLFRAVNMKSSDIHVQEGSENGEVRLRINGALTLVASTSLEYTRKVLSLIKLSSNLNVAERRMPQDGRFTIEMKGETIDARVSTVPVMTNGSGESCVIRLINKQSSLKSISELDLPPRQMSTVRSALDKKSGLVLVTGPTGSGKTSTLYACLNEINRVDVAIVTIEDPVEIVLHRAKQLQVNTAINLTFSRLLRAVLRHDPDVIMVGEIRDKETADHAIQAAQTGHLVFATLHTNDALRAIPRLEALGTDRNQLANSLIMVQAQRLVRLICLNCRKPRKLLERERETILKHLPEEHGRTPEFQALLDEWNELIERTTLGNGSVYDACGCISCHQTGYTKRRAVMEVFPIDDHVRDMIENGAKVGAISQYVHKQGHTDLAMESLRLFLGGDTTYDEIKGYLKI